MDDRDQYFGAIKDADGNYIDEFKLRLGDMQFDVPPVQIQVINRVSGNRVPLMNAKSSIITDVGHSDVQIELVLFFDSLESINGKPYVVELPNGNSVVYFMNGLRALISQFKFCPFLPVENFYLNQVLGIDAVVLGSFAVSSVEGYPGLVQVNLTMFSFDCTAMIPLSEEFHTIFDWPLFRYYYQRPLREIKDVTYIKAISELDNDFTFSVINDAYLEQKKKRDKKKKEKSTPAEQKEDIENIMVDYPIDNLYITQISASMQNTLVPIQVQSGTTPTYQHFGSQDVVFDVCLETTDSSALESFNSLMHHAAYLVREYKNYISAGFLGFEHSFSQLFGVDFVIITQAAINTIAPEHYAIDLKMMAYNRHQRDMATPKKLLDLDYSKRNDSELRFLQYQECLDALKYIEIRPDLELPTCSELKNAGFSISGDAYYPDPDFYIKGAIDSVGDMVEDAFGTQQTGKFQDKYGGEQIIKTPIVQDGKVTRKCVDENYKGLNDKANEMWNGAYDIYKDSGLVSAVQNMGNNLSTDTSTSTVPVSGTLPIPNVDIYSCDGNSNPDKEAIKMRVAAIAIKKGIPPNVALALVESESDFNHYYPGTQVPMLALVGNANTAKSKISSILAYGNKDSVSGSDCVGLMQVQLRGQDTSTWNALCYDINYNIEVGFNILMSKYNSVANDANYKSVRGRAFPSYLADLVSSGMITDMWLRAILCYKGCANLSWSDSRTESHMKRFSCLLPNYIGYSGYQSPIGELAGFSSSGNTNLLQMFDGAEGNTPEPGDLDDIVYESTYDMRKTDKRGRLVRAFPSFLLLLLDEGEYIGTYKLQDNFYTYYAINQIEVHKSRKSAADTCIFTMSNAFNNINNDQLSYEDESSSSGVRVIIDAVQSLIWPDIEKLSDLRSKASKLAYLRAGARIHLRMGYGTDVRQLPVIMNGCITEIGTGDVIDVIAQGDGIELTSKLPFPPKFETGEGGAIGNILGLARTPRELIYTILTWRGSWVKSFVHKASEGFFYDSSPLGINHFGNTGRDALFSWNRDDSISGAEIMQNIYPADSSLSLSSMDDETKEAVDSAITDVAEATATGNGPIGTLIAKMFLKLGMQISTPEIYDEVYDSEPKEKSFEIMIFDKCFWDVLQILAGATPDYIAAVHPFGFRSTIFFGKPYFNMIYDYDDMEKIAESEINLTDGILTQIEKERKAGSYIYTPRKKPFRQHHIYTSLYDIVSNKIKVSENNMCTCVMGIYTANKGSDEPVTTPPVWLDSDIYTEKQRTKVIDTSIYVGGIKLFNNTPILRWITRGVNWLERELGEGSRIAIDVARTALKSYVQDMYQGELLVIGDPSVKPYDMFYLMDSYEEMSGLAEVKEVVHHFGLETGFVTSIVPDVAVAMDDPFIVQHWQIWNNIVASVGARVILLGLSRLYRYSGSTPLLNMLVNAAGKGTDKFLNLLKNPLIRKPLEKIHGITFVTQLEHAAANSRSADLAKDVIKIVRSTRAVGPATAGVVGGAAIAFKFPPALLLAIVEFLAVYLVSACVGEYLGRWLSCRESLKIMALKKNGTPFVAGIDGHQGCVYGDSADTITALVRDNKWVRGILKYVCGVDTLDTSLAYMPLGDDDMLDPVGYYERVEEALGDLEDYGIVDKDGSSSDGGISSGVVKRPGNFWDIMSKYAVSYEHVQSSSDFINLNSQEVRNNKDLTITIIGTGKPYLRKGAYTRLCRVAKAVKAAKGSPLVITSTYRTNAKSHKTGFAIDIDIPGQYKQYGRDSNGKWYMTNNEGKAWLYYVIEQLILNGFIAIMISDYPIVEEMKRKYGADISHDNSANDNDGDHRTHIHCVAPPQEIVDESNDYLGFLAIKQ